MSQRSRDTTPVYAIRQNLYLNLTNRCTNRCAFCPKLDRDWEVKGHDLRLKREPSAAEILAGVDDPGRYEEIVFCGLGEPTLRLETMLAVARGIGPGSWRRRLNTDGLANRVHDRDVTPELAGHLEAVSISLNAQDSATYARHCRPRLPDAHAAVLDFTRRVRAHVPEVTLSAIEGLDGVDIAACEEIAVELGVHFRRRALDVVG